MTATVSSSLGKEIYFLCDILPQNFTALYLDYKNRNLKKSSNKIKMSILQEQSRLEI